MDENAFIEGQLAFMENIVAMHDKVKNVHLSLENLYPITVINNGFYFVFDISKTSGKYVFKSKVKSSISVSSDILTSFILDFYDMKPSAVVSKNIFENQKNNIYIFREFVHCFQLENGAVEIMKELSIQKQELAKNNFNWEVNFPFPYDNKYFIDKTMELYHAFAKGNNENILVYRNCMRTYLQKTEYEYMIWEQWKEGFTGYIENLIRKELGLQLNTFILGLPFNRTHFFEIGSKFVDMLLKKDKELNDNIIKLFQKMITCE